MVNKTIIEIILIRTDSGNKDFMMLVEMLDAFLAEIDGKDHSFYAQYNKIDTLKNVIVAYENNIPVACGAIKEYAPGVMEIKRMFTIPEKRGKGIAAKILNELEEWAAALNYKKCILETGKKQEKAVELYQRSGYKIILNYGQYAGVDNSICFEKLIR